ncbi:MAG: TIGR02117 family protein [Tangfeifania sp.]
MRIPKIIGRFLQLLKTILFVLAGLTVIYFLTALFLSYLPDIPEDGNCEPDQTIYITSNGVHLDIVLPVKNMEKQLLSMLEIPAETQFVSFGWGDKNFYIKTPEWSDLTIPVAFKAAFLKSDAAMHVIRHRQTYRHWKKVELCRHQLDSLNSFIENSFKKTETGGLQKINFPGYSEDDSFYEAKGYFTLFKTCNVWTNNAMKEIEVKTSVWSPFDFGVLYHLPD